MRIALFPLMALCVAARGIGLEARCWHKDRSCTVNPGADTPGVPDCELAWFDQQLDHLNFRSNNTFKQRYFVHREFWKPGGPIFFYCGNEASVELYVNATGLMWENAKDFGAMLVFAEHRYYGETLPFGDASFTPENLQWLTMEQALADYAHLLASLKRDVWKSEESKVVAFGGSYGGMLAAWLRMKYPSAVVGSIAGSAPILAFDGLPDQYSQWNGEKYWQVVSKDATSAAGAEPECADNIRKVWPVMFELGKTPAGRAELQDSFKLCKPLESEADVSRLAGMHLNALDSMAMGNFPYPSNYLIYQQTLDPSLMLPAFPVREACKFMKGPFSDQHSPLRALADASGVFYNATNVSCFELPADPDFDGIWDYQWCSEMQPQETYFSRDGVNDMFWPSGMNMTAINEHCRSTLGITPRPRWIGEEFGGATGATNIVFSNGLYDPWSSGGVLSTANLSSTVHAVIIPEGAHHLDLMFSNPQDPASVISARQVEMQSIREWLA
eukprot:TRINITY_DN1932_c0_g1_i2.p1 TRINITY_DN1932_c0_g1~~TRINITY_DN1932_c0_g1_i2.p1  ORF type:complete len:500 (-),score=96.07 TRINITY_DN1932_c0_g1_i2:95-1594(-)